MITVGSRRILVIDYDPNGILSGVSGDIAIFVDVAPALYVCQGGTVWSLL